MQLSGHEQQTAPMRRDFEICGVDPTLQCNNARLLWAVAAGMHQLRAATAARISEIRALQLAHLLLAQAQEVLS
jgi:hypothetical protein